MVKQKPKSFFSSYEKPTAWLRLLVAEESWMLLPLSLEYVTSALMRVNQP
jgi:hypothetical protein